MPWARLPRPTTAWPPPTAVSASRSTTAPARWSSPYTTTPGQVLFTVPDVQGAGYRLRREPGPVGGRRRWPHQATSSSLGISSLGGRLAPADHRPGVRPGHQLHHLGADVDRPAAADRHCRTSRPGMHRAQHQPDQRSSPRCRAWPPTPRRCRARACSHRPRRSAQRLLARVRHGHLGRRRGGRGLPGRGQPRWPRRPRRRTRSRRRARPTRSRSPRRPTARAGTAQTYNLAANATAQDLVNAVNADQNGSVWGTVVNGNIVFSDRTTGAPTTFNVSDSAGSMALQGTATAGHQRAVLDQRRRPAQLAVEHDHQRDPGRQSDLRRHHDRHGRRRGQRHRGRAQPVHQPDPVGRADVRQLLQRGARPGQRPAQPGAEHDRSHAGKLYGDPELTGLLSNMRQAMYTRRHRPARGHGVDARTSASAPAPRPAARHPTRTRSPGHLTIDSTNARGGHPEQPVRRDRGAQELQPELHQHGQRRRPGRRHDRHPHPGRQQPARRTSSNQISTMQSRADRQAGAAHPAVRRARGARCRRTSRRRPG